MINFDIAKLKQNFNYTQTKTGKSFRNTRYLTFV